MIEEAAREKGWKVANFVRVSALERAAQVLNLSRPTSFDFAGEARHIAAVLVGQRTVAIAEYPNSDPARNFLGRVGYGAPADQLEEPGRAAPASDKGRYVMERPT